MHKKIVYIDMDGVIVDLGTNINNWFNKHPDLHKKYNVSIPNNLELINGKFFVSEEVLPQTISLLQTRSIPLGIELVIGNHQEFDFSAEYFGVLLQYPGKFGQIYNYQSAIFVGLGVP